MKIKCPNCEADYNISDDKIKINSTKLKCTKCEFTFVVVRENIIEKNKVDKTSDPSSGRDDQENIIEQAMRLAEVIISDIQIYNREKIKNCKTDAELVITLSSELKKGREYFLKKTNPNLKNPNKYYAEAVRKFLKIKKQ